MNRAFLRSTVAVMTIATTSCLAAGQDTESHILLSDADVNDRQTQRDRDQHWIDRVQLSLHGGVEYQFTTDIDKGGDFSVTRGGIGITARSKINDDVNLSFRFDYNLDAYDFSGAATGLGFANPWDDIHTVSLGALLSIDIGNDWTLFGGPLLQIAGESGADFGDSITGGGLVAASYRASETLTVGGGIVVVSQIEDSARVFPVFVLHWQINDSLSLRNTSAEGAGTRSGVELVWNSESNWEAAFGGAYQFKRFRLDDRSNTSNNGVGEDSSIPIWVRFTYRIGDNSRINVYAGVAFDGEVRLENSGGNGIGSSEYDTAAIIGVSGSIRF